MALLTSRGRSPAFICSACGDLRHKYRAQCAGCGAYLTYLTMAQARGRGLALPIGMNGGSGKRLHHMTTGVEGLDAMCSRAGGLVRGKCYMIVAAPGSGKSTLWLQVCAHIGQRRRVVYAYLEEGEDTAEAMMMRLGLPLGHVLGVEAESVEQLCERTAGADLVVLDSLQGLRNRCGLPEEKIAEALGNHAHATGQTFVLISHVNKEGEARGTMETQHWVDVVLEMSGEKGQALRLLAASKSRCGPTDRVRFLRMTEHGLVDVPDASSYLIADRTPGEPGSAIAAVLVKRGEGTASVLVEVQAMLTAVDTKADGSTARPGRVVCDAIDGARLRIILNVLEKVGVETRSFDLTVKVCGDIKGIDDQGIDLPVALAVVSASRDTPLPEICAWGEVDLVGHIRGVAAREQRLEEAKRAQFKPIEPGQHKSLRELIDTLLIDPVSKVSKIPRHGRAAADTREPDAGRRGAARVPAPVAGGGRRRIGGVEKSVPQVRRAKAAR
jgi:DNA repair protein RadA/Sms